MADPTRFMTLNEVLRIIKDLKRRKKRSRSSHLNLIVLRLSCCCGLRRKEIAGLRFTDLVLSGARPCIIIRKHNTKGRLDQRRARKVPLWWDTGTLDDIREWVEFRTKMGVTASDTVLCGVSKGNYGNPLEDGHPLPWAGTGPAVVHPLRATFVLLALQGGRSLLDRDSRRRGTHQRSDDQPLSARRRGREHPRCVRSTELDSGCATNAASVEDHRHQGIPGRQRTGPRVPEPGDARRPS